MGEEDRVQRQDALEQRRAQVRDDPLAGLGDVEIAQRRRQPERHGVEPQDQEPQVDVPAAVLESLVDGAARRRRQGQGGRGRADQPEPRDGRVRLVPRQEGQQAAQRTNVAALGALARRLLHLVGQESAGAGTAGRRSASRLGVALRICVRHGRALAPERPPV
ncbi:hypothetical protein D3C73_1038590 [compost metagenome]